MFMMLFMIQATAFRNGCVLPKLIVFKSKQALTSDPNYSGRIRAEIQKFTPKLTSSCHDGWAWILGLLMQVGGSSFVAEGNLLAIQFFKMHQHEGTIWLKPSKYKISCRV